MSETWKPLPVYFLDNESNLETIISIIFEIEWDLETTPVVFLDNDWNLETIPSVFFR
jgi:hypothetical protein